jgi:hypothetical protein
MGASDGASGGEASSVPNGSSGSASSSGGSSTGGATTSGGMADGAAAGSSGGSSNRTTSDAGKDGTVGVSDANAAADANSPVDSGGAVVSSGDGGGLDAIRQTCVDQINMHRATLNLAPVARATPAQEACSDMGAMHDATTMMAHSSSSSCPGFPGYQNSCPDLPVGSFSGATLQSSLIQCLNQMWAEGPPPGTVAACEADITGCFQQHGHYINMTNASLKTVSCGFYKMSNGDYWGNQDYAP